MLINFKFHGPSYSTDAVAQDVTRFMARRPAPQTSAPHTSTPRTAESGLAGRLEILYPSLYARPERAGLAATLRGAVAKAGAIFGRRAAGEVRPVTGL